MKLREIVNLLQAEVLVGEEHLDDIEVDSCFSADLMSDVLGRAHANGIMVTGITNPQAVRTADIADIKAVCLVRRKQPEAETLALAKQKRIPFFTTKLTMFEACGILYMNGLRGVAERQ
ncbi:MAG: DRTGG domain-containing protein [Nitrospirota bacterium]